MREAFSMFTAIVVLMMMASIAALVFNTAGKITKETTSQYRKEQAMLLSKSYTEFAVLAIQGHNMSTNGCLKTITGIINYTGLDATNNANASNNGEGYNVRVTLRYIGLPGSVTCSVNSASTSGSVSAIVDTYVRYRDPDNPASAESSTWSNVPWITYHRRTLQKL